MLLLWILSLKLNIIDSVATIFITTLFCSELFSLLDPKKNTPVAHLFKKFQAFEDYLTDLQKTNYKSKIKKQNSLAVI
jgi:hypothetical protein